MAVARGNVARHVPEIADDAPDVRRRSLAELEAYAEWRIEEAKRHAARSLADAGIERARSASADSGHVVRPVEGTSMPDRQSAVRPLCPGVYSPGSFGGPATFSPMLAEETGPQEAVTDVDGDVRTTRFSGNYSSGFQSGNVAVSAASLADAWVFLESYAGTARWEAVAASVAAKTAYGRGRNVDYSTVADSQQTALLRAAEQIALLLDTVPVRPALDEDGVPQSRALRAADMPSDSPYEIELVGGVAAWEIPRARRCAECERCLAHAGASPWMVALCDSPIQGIDHVTPFRVLTRCLRQDVAMSMRSDVRQGRSYGLISDNVELACRDDLAYEIDVTTGDIRTIGNLGEREIPDLVSTVLRAVVKAVAAEGAPLTHPRGRGMSAVASEYLAVAFRRQPSESGVRLGLADFREWYAREENAARMERTLGRMALASA